MSRTRRFSLLVALVVATTATSATLVVAGEPAADNTQRVVDLLADAGITTDATELEALSVGHGLGGAVRILMWADALGVDPSDIAAAFDGGMGWGQLRRALAEVHEDFDHGPGIGSIMGSKGHGHGQGQLHGQGHNKNKPAVGDETGD